MKKNTSNSERDYYILGIHDGHNCGAALSLNGKIIASISEERLTRKKNDIGYPKKSINECLKLAGIDSTNLSDIVFASNFMHEPSFLKNITPWYLVGKTDQDRDKSVSEEYEKVVFLRRKATLKPSMTFVSPPVVEFFKQCKICIVGTGIL